MVATYDVSTAAGKVRLKIGDTNTANALFEDDEIAAFLSMEGDDIRLASAAALDAIAANQVMVLKVLRLMDLQTDGAAVARELRQQAAALRKEADLDAVFDWAEMTVDEFAAREIEDNSILRSL